MAGGYESTIVETLMLADLPSMAGFYVIALIVGGGLVLISALFGGGSHHDVELDFDGAGAFDGVDVESAELPTDVEHVGGVDVNGDGADLDHSGSSLADWFSLRFVVYFAATFGLTGTTLTMMTQMERGMVLVVSIVTGFIVGQVVHQTMRWLQRSSSDSSTRAGDYINRPGRVTVSIPVKGRGEVAIQIRDGERCLPAVAQRDDESFKAGAQVAVLKVESGAAVVVSREEFEFLKTA